MKKGFFGSLFDFSFTSFITPRLVPVLYALGLVLGVISLVIYLITASALPSGYGGLVIVAALIGALLTIILVRVWSEVIMVTFRVYERVTTNPANVARAAGPPAPVFQPASPVNPAKPAADIASVLDGGDTVEKLTRLKSLLDAGSITREDFDREKVRLLAQK